MPEDPIHDRSIIPHQETLPDSTLELIAVEPGDWQGALANEFARFRIAVGQWAHDIQSGNGDKDSTQIDSYRTALYEFKTAVKKGEPLPSLDQYFSAIVSPASLCITYTQSSDSSGALFDEELFHHDLGNELLKYNIYKKAKGDEIEKQEGIRHILDTVILLSEGKLSPEILTVQQIYEAISLCCRRAKKSYEQEKAIGDVVVEGLHDDNNIELTWSKTYIARLVGNIFQNVIRLKDKKPINLHVAIKKTDTHILVRWDDDGPGYPQELLGTYPFKKGKSMHNTGRKGSGIGMYGLQEDLGEQFSGHFVTDNESSTLGGGRLTVAIPITTTL